MRLYAPSKNEAKKKAGENRMKRLLVGALALFAMSAAMPAIAADLPAQTYSKAPVLMPALYDWSGFYLGLNGGWGTESRCWDSISANGAIIAADGCHNTSGGFAGGQLGYRFQTGPWVWGLDLQGDWADLKGSSVSIVNPANINRSRMDGFGLFTGQIGYAFNTALLYFKGGGALVADRNDVISNGVIVASAPGDNRWGGTVGLGAEFSFAPNWSAAVEWDHLFIANNNAAFTMPAGGVFGTGGDRLRGDADMVSVRVNYRWGGPVVGKY
jgi:outer membrane immunogenic protein